MQSTNVFPAGFTRRTALALVLAVLFTLVAPARPAAAADGLAIRSDTTFVVQPESETIAVSATYSVTNVTPDRRTRTGTTQYYYTGLSIPVPTEAIDVTAVRSDGRTLSLTLEEPEDGFYSVFADVSFGRNVFYRSTTTFTVSYVIPSAEVRSETSGVRINPAYAVFGAYGIGDPNAVSVRVEVPLGYDVEIEGSSFESTIEGDVRIYEATDIVEPEEFYLFVVARNDDALEQRIVPVGDDRSVRILHWPGDEEWADFVEEELNTGFVELKRLIGLPFEDEELEIIESVDPSLQGYAGWYIPSEERIEVSEDLNTELILHELSHAWFNGDLFAERWITEGLAEEFSAQAVAAKGDRPQTPTSPTFVNRYSLPLNRWRVGAVNSEERQGTDRYGYNASWFVINQLTEEIGIDAVAEIVRDAQADRIAYRGDVEVELVDRSVDNWRRFLDLAEEVEGSTTASELFDRYVVTEAEKDLLDRRARSRDSYAELVQQGESWAPPVALRTLMSDWSFDQADDTTEASAAVLTARSDLLRTIAEIDLEMPPSPEVAYETSESIEELETVEVELGDIQRAAEVLIVADEAVAAERGLIERIGLIRTDFEMPYEQSRQLFNAEDPTAAVAQAQVAIEGYANAKQVGTDRVVVAVSSVVGVLVIAALLIRWRRRRKRRSLSDGASSDTATDADDVPTSDIDGGEDRDISPSTPPDEPALVSAGRIRATGAASEGKTQAGPADPLGPTEP